MYHIGISEAKNSFLSLVHQVELGDEILITRWGQPVAKLIALDNKSNKVKALTAANNIRERAKTLKLGRFRWKEYRDARRR